MRGYSSFESPIGTIYIVVGQNGVEKIELFEDEWHKYVSKNDDLIENPLICQEVITQLKEYFRGEREVFTTPIHLNGTAFQKNVWEALSKIPYGETRSYLDIANWIQNPQAVRAVGQANRKNPIPIIIPCHRVIGKSGKLVGFAGNHTSTQEVLINLEKSTTCD